MSKLKSKRTENLTTKIRNVADVKKCHDKTFRQIFSHKQCTSTLLQSTNEKKATNHVNNIDHTSIDDEHNYEHDIPIKYTAAQQLLELKLQSSLLQILQREIPNIRNVPIECTNCKLSYCFDCTKITKKLSKLGTESLAANTENVKQSSRKPISSVNQSLTRQAELDHERESKWESYMTYIEPKKCECSKMSKKHLLKQLPAYMTKMSHYDAPELLKYEKCPVIALKALVKTAMEQKEIYASSPTVLSGVKDIGIQYSDQCICSSCCYFNADNYKAFKKFRSPKKEANSLNTTNPFQMVGSTISPAYLKKDISSFARDRAISLRNFVEEAPDIKEIFKGNIVRSKT